MTTDRGTLHNTLPKTICSVIIEGTIFLRICQLTSLLIRNISNARVLTFPGPEHLLLGLFSVFLE
jgi:hypothetical protein